MKDTIEKGDTVTAYWVINGEQLTGAVIHVPQDTGDMWIIKTDKGYVSHINPNCSNLEQICRSPFTPKTEEHK